MKKTKAIKTRWRKKKAWGIFMRQKLMVIWDYRPQRGNFDVRRVEIRWPERARGKK